MKLGRLDLRAQLGLLGLVLLVTLVTFGVVTSVRDAASAPAAVEVPISPEPVSGAWACAVGDGRTGASLTVTAANPADEAPATVGLTGIDGGEVTPFSTGDVLAGEALILEPDVSASGVVTARWQGEPVALSREWRLDGRGGLAAGIVAGPCVPPFAQRWIVPGLSTVGSEQAFLRLANPFASDATVAASFLTPEGRVDPLALQNLTVPARGMLEIPVNEHLPERADLAAVIDVLAGRAATEGFQVVDTEIGEVEGVTLLAAAPTASETWTLPWVVDRDEDASWLWITNPTDRTAIAELTLHTDEAGGLLETLSGVEVPPGTVRRVDLSDTMPEDVDEAALTVRADGVEIVVSAGYARTADEPEDTGLAIALGAPVGDTSWVVSGGDVGEERSERLRIVNLGGADATVAVTIFDGEAVQRPDDLAAVGLSAGAVIDLDLTDELEGLDAWTAVVSSDQDVVVGRVGEGGEDGLLLVSTLGQPSVAARPAVTPLVGTALAGLVNRFGTALGIARPALPDGVEEEDDPGEADTDPGPDGASSDTDQAPADD